MKPLFGFLLCREVSYGQSLCHVVTTVLKGSSQGTSGELSLQKWWHSVMILMNHSLNFFSDHEKAKNSIQLCWMAGRPENFCLWICKLIYPLFPCSRAIQHEKPPFKVSLNIFRAESIKCSQCVLHCQLCVGFKKSELFQICTTRIFWGIVNNFVPLFDVANTNLMLLCYVVLYSKSGFDLGPNHQGSAYRFI